MPFLSAPCLGQQVSQGTMAPWLVQMWPIFLGVSSKQESCPGFPARVSFLGFLPALEARSLGWRCRGVTLPLLALGEGPSHLYQLLGAAGVPWLVATSLQSLRLHMAFLKGYQSLRAHPTSV